MICEYSIRHLAYFRTICEGELHKYKEVGIERSLFLSVLLGWVHMPHHLANLLKAEVREFAAHPDQPASSHSSRTCRESGSAFSKGTAALTCYLSSHPEKCTLRTQILSTVLAMGWLVLFGGKTATATPDRIRAKHVSMTPERQRATMERKQLCICLLVHTHRSRRDGN